MSGPGDAAVCEGEFVLDGGATRVWTLWNCLVFSLGVLKKPMFDVVSVQRRDLAKIYSSSACREKRASLASDETSQVRV